MRSEIVLDGATGWLNSPPLTGDDLRGKVVAVDFWTYTCVNWLRTLPYLKAWHERYAERGLVVLGVHTPEFSFEGDFDNVRRAVQDLGIGYPVVADSDYAIWRAFSNHYWPAIYLVDRDGRIRDHHFGEGRYEETEQNLRQLLGGDFVDDLVRVEPVGLEVAADWDTLQSGENYVGYGRTDHFASPDQPVLDQPHFYPEPSGLSRNQWAPAGIWTIGQEAATSDDADSRISYTFHARDLNLVMGPKAHQGEVRFRVTVDGRPPGPAHGSDVDAQGYGTVVEERLYQLVRQPPPVTDREFEIEFLDPGVATYVFTFG
jgi:thiol-disulfide isomerase/thioredoxin